MIIDVQNTLNEFKNASIPPFFPSQSLNFSSFTIVMMVSQCAVGETVLSWQAADGATTFSDRPPFDATDITVRTLSKPSSPVGGFGGTEEWLSDKMHIVVACEVSELAKNELQKAPQKKDPQKRISNL